MVGIFLVFVSNCFLCYLCCHVCTVTFLIRYYNDFVPTCISSTRTYILIVHYSYFEHAVVLVVCCVVDSAVID